MLKRFQLCLALGLLALAIPASAQDKTDKNQPAQAAAAAGSNAAARNATQDPNYIIGAQDVLDVSVWKEPDLTRSVPVRPDGKISLPLLNDVQAAGLTPAQLAAQITTSLKKFVTDPQVTVIVSAINSQRIFVMGEVIRAGAYPLLPNMTVLQALSASGGFTQYANLKKIYVLRQEEGKQVKYPFNYKDAVGGKQPEQNITLKAGDTIIVP